MPKPVDLKLKVCNYVLFVTFQIHCVGVERQSPPKPCAIILSVNQKRALKSSTAQQLQVGQQLNRHCNFDEEEHFSSESRTDEQARDCFCVSEVMANSNCEYKAISRRTEVDYRQERKHHESCVTLQAFLKAESSPAYRTSFTPTWTTDHGSFLTSGWEVTVETVT